jgi:hypothetical protein
MPKFHCIHCGQQHEGLPAFHADRPTPYWDVPETQRETDIAERFFFVHGCLEIPILDHDEKFVWGVWVSLKEENFLLWQDHYDAALRSHIGPFFGWLCTQLPIYPDTMHLKTMVHLQDHGIRPRIELELTDHPLSIAQHEGITLQTALEIVHALSE